MVCGLWMFHTDRIEEWQKAKAVLVTSPDKFKGMEADAVVILEETDGKAGDDDLSRNYVACSRAKHLLTIVHWKNRSKK